MDEKQQLVAAHETIWSVCNTRLVFPGHHVDSILHRVGGDHIAVVSSLIVFATVQLQLHVNSQLCDGVPLAISVDAHQTHVAFAVTCGTDICHYTRGRVYGRVNAGMTQEACVGVSILGTLLYVGGMFSTIQRLLLAKVRHSKASLRLLAAQDQRKARHYSTHELQCWKCDKKISAPSDNVLLTCPCEQLVLLPPTCRNYFTIMQWCGRTLAQKRNDA